MMTRILVSIGAVVALLAVSACGGGYARDNRVYPAYRTAPYYHYQDGYYRTYRPAYRPAYRSTIRPANRPTTIICDDDGDCQRYRGAPARRYIILDDND